MYILQKNSFARAEQPNLHFNMHFIRAAAAYSYTVYLCTSISRTAQGSSQHIRYSLISLIVTTYEVICTVLSTTCTDCTTVHMYSYCTVFY